LNRWLRLIIIVAMTAWSGCSSSHLAPEAPDRPWKPAGSSDNSTQARFELPNDPSLLKGNRSDEADEVQVDAGHVYTLPELIDLAERTNPETRIAWEDARQAAFAVGLVEANYLPQIAVEVLGGFQHSALPIPQNVDPRGYFISNSQEILPSLVLKWLLFDFGKRKGLVEAAKQTSIASNVAFTGAHQKLIFEVSRAYFALDAERIQLHVAEDALKNSETLQSSVTAKKKRGLQTVTEVALAHRETAKSQFELEKAKGADNDAYHGLLEAMGLRPTLKLRIAESEGRALPKGLLGEVNAYIDRALLKRPDIVAGLAKLRASESEVTSAKSAYYPTIGVEGLVSQNVGSLDIDGGPSYRVNQPTASVLFKLSWSIFDGGIRKNTVEIAQSKNASAEDELSKTRDQAIRQIAKAYDAVKTTLAEYDSTLALVKASDIAYSSSVGSYNAGVGTFTDAITAETEKSQAMVAQAQAYASVLTSAAALAFSTGELSSIEAVGSSE
jgi:outer membrane protein